MKQSWMQCRLPLHLPNSASCAVQPTPSPRVASSMPAAVLLLLLHLALTALCCDNLSHLAVSPTRLWALRRLELHLIHWDVSLASSTLLGTQMMLRNYH